MTQPFSPQTQQLKVRTSVLVFLKGNTAPLVLYVENPAELYEEVLTCLKSPTSSKLLEVDTNGPIKHVAFQSNQVGAVALQEEQYIQ